MNYLKFALDLLVATGRITYYGKGLCKCVKDVAVITYKIYNLTDWSHGSLSPRIDIDEF